MVLAGVLSAFLMLSRSGVSAANYSMAEAEIRRAIEHFSQDVRMANGIEWTSDTSVTLILPSPNAYASTDAAHNNRVTYAYGSGIFYKLPGAATSTATRTVLVRNLSSFQFFRFNRLNGTATSNADTKLLRFTMNVRQAHATVVTANTNLVLGTYLLRNKVAN
jgi:Tfp pilus assembly protein PilW